MLLRHAKDALCASGNGMSSNDMCLNDMSSNDISSRFEVEDGENNFVMPQMNHSTKFLFETPFAEKIYAALSPEAGSDPGEKSWVQLSCDESRLALYVEAEDVSAMRASLNMWLRLINVSNEVLEL